MLGSLNLFIVPITYYVKQLAKYIILQPVALFYYVLELAIYEICKMLNIGH